MPLNKTQPQTLQYIVLLHDNVRLHFVRFTQEKILVLS